MKTTAKIFSLLSIAAAGLLLGGNVSAAGSSTTITIDNASALIQQIQQKINDLASQLQRTQDQSAAPITIAAAPALPQSQLDYIQSQVDRIAGETARLKIEVGVFTTLRQIQWATAALNAEIARGQQPTAAATPAQQPATAVDDDNRRDIEAKIAKVKQQIAELNQEIQMQKSIETPAVTAAGGDQCVGQNCPVGTSEQKITTETAPLQTTASQPEKKGFWQSVGDFLKKIFTF